MKICRPSKNCKPTMVTQGFFPKQHESVDWGLKFGEVLVAPFNCTITRIAKPKDMLEYGANWENGCGLLMTSIENPDTRVSFWHTLPFFFVSEGDTVLQGNPVAQCGNTGWVESNGVLVPMKDRFTPYYKGTHLHYSMGIGTTNVDCRNYIDWNIPINYDMYSLANILLTKIYNFIKK